MSISRALVAFGLSLCLAGCQVDQMTNEPSGPSITLTLLDKLHNQGWPEDRKVLDSNTTVTVKPDMDILITVSAHDQGGVSTLDNVLMFFANGCGNPPGGAFVSTIDTSNQMATPHPPNTITDTLFYLREITTSSLKTQPCTVGPGTSTGLGTVYVIASATNPSDRFSDRLFKIHTTGGVTGD
jgi:hypothetical protein